MKMWLTESTFDILTFSQKRLHKFQEFYTHSMEQNKTSSCLVFCNVWSSFFLEFAANYKIFLSRFYKKILNRLRKFIDHSEDIS